MFRIALLGIFLLVLNGMASALDANDISQMIRNGVQDSAIINVVRTRKLERPLTAQEVLLLNTSGASPTLLEYLTRPEVVGGSHVVASSAPTMVTSSGNTTYVAPSTTVAPPDPMVVTPVYPTTTYIVPDYVYPMPTYVYPYPYTYVYPYNYDYYPYYRYQSESSFNFFFGGRRK